VNALEYFKERRERDRRRSMDQVMIKLRQIAILRRRRSESHCLLNLTTCNEGIDECLVEIMEIIGEEIC
jgi:hypothetical protein